MNAKWFCKIDQQEYGPLLIAQLRRLSARGQLKADSFVRREDSDIWISAADVPELNLGIKKSGLPRAKPSASRAMPPPPVSSSIPVAAVAPPVTPTHVTPVASEPSVQVATQPTAHPSAGVGSAARPHGSEGVSRTMLAGLIGLGCVVVILLVTVIFLISGHNKSDGEQAAANHSDVTDEFLKPKQVATNESKVNSVVTAVPTKLTTTTNITAAVSHWSKPSSVLRIINKATRSAVCNVGIKSVWVSNDLKGEVDERRPPAVAINDAVKNHAGDDDVLDLSALGVSKKKRVDVTGKIIESQPETPVVMPTEGKQQVSDTPFDPSSFRYVFVQVSVSNTSADEPLVYRGWNGDGNTDQQKDAKLFDQDGNVCLFVSLTESARDDRCLEKTLAPGEAAVDVLVFKLPESGFESLRLVLPKEAIGVPGHMGYEIQKSDIDGGLPEAYAASTDTPRDAAEGHSTPPTKADLEREIQNLREDLTKPDGATGTGAHTEQPLSEKPPEKKRDAKEEFQDLKRLIEAEKEKD